VSQLHLVNPDGKPQKHITTIDELLLLLRPEHFDGIEARARTMREAFQCPPTVRDYEEFKAVLYEYFVHYQKWWFHADIKAATAKLGGGDDVWRQDAYRFLQEHLGGYDAILAAERNAVRGREGGMIRVIDDFTEGIIKRHIQTYIESIFYERIGPSDFDLHLRLAAELLRRFGPVLFPGEELLPHYFIGMRLKEILQGFAVHVHAIRKQWRY
jgi:hypothetical protein